MAFVARASDIDSVDTSGKRFDEALESMLTDVIARRPELARGQELAGDALRHLLRRLADRRSAIALELITRGR